MAMFALELALHWELICIQKMCAPKGYSFTNKELEVEIGRRPPDNLIVTLHEKDPVRIRRFNTAVMNIMSSQGEVTFKTLGAFLNATKEDTTG